MEHWQAIVGWPEYEVSSHGRVRSRPRMVVRRNGRSITVPGRVLRTCPTSNGHLTVMLTRPGVRVRRYVHHLVLEAFVGPAFVGAVCRHFPDRSPRNNHATNLRWGTPAENQADRVTHGTDTRGSRSTNAVLTEESVRHIRSSDLTNTELADRYGVGRAQISAVRRRRAWAHVP